MAKVMNALEKDKAKKLKAKKFKKELKDVRGKTASKTKIKVTKKK